MIRDIKTYNSENYNYIFDYKSGFFARWGKTKADDPEFSPVGPEILDIEITTKCTGINGKVCKFCYKGNTPKGKNMKLQDFKVILDKMLQTDKQAGITQVAFGADSTCLSNPDLFAMMDYCRSKKVVPNITVAQLSDDVADELIKRVGAVAVSRYDDQDVCYDAVKKLTDRGLQQTNIHVMISEETFENAYKTMQNYLYDNRLRKLNAIVFLSLKQKGRGTTFTPLSQDKFNKLIEYAFDNNIPIGFDSCSAHKFLAAIKGRDDYEKLAQHVEPCESSMFSSYIDVNGDFYPCSFAPDTLGWEKGISVLEAKNFIDDVWNNERTKKFRETLSKNCRNCPLYKI